MGDLKSRDLCRAEQSYRQLRILKSLTAGDDDASAWSVLLMEESSARGSASPAFSTEYTSTGENLWQAPCRAEQLTFASMREPYSDLANLAEEMISQERGMNLMTRQDESIDTNNIIPAFSTVSASQAGTCSNYVPDPFAESPIARQGLQLPFRSGAGSNSSVGEGLIRVEVDQNLSWIVNSSDEPNSTMMKQAGSADASQPFSAERSTLTADYYSIMKAGSGATVITGTREYDSPSDHVESRLNGSQMGARVRLQTTNPETPNSEQSLSSSISDGSGNAMNSSSCRLQQLDVAEIRGTMRPDQVGRSVEGAAGDQEDHDMTRKQQQQLVSKPKKLRQPLTLQPKKKSMKRVRQPKHCIKTRTDVDIMDDNYKWRKYGQKAVKNSPYPRNYYKCSTQNCPVRKRVERCADDPGLVLTTYEGTHTHQSPILSRLPFGAYIGGFSHPSSSGMHPLLISSPTGLNTPNLTTSNLPLFAQRLEPTASGNINSVGSLSRPAMLLSQCSKLACNTCNSIATPTGIAPSSSTAYLSGSQQFGGGPLVDPSLLRQVLDSNHHQQLAEDATSPNAQVEPGFLRPAPAQFAQAGTLQQFNNNKNGNKSVEAQLQSTTGGQGLVDSGDQDGLLRLPSLWSEEVTRAISWPDEGLLEDMVRTSIPTFGLT